MCIEFRALNPEEEDKVIDFIEKGYGFAPMPHFKWKLMDNPLWRYEHSRVGEFEGEIVAAGFFEPVAMKFLSGTIPVMIFGAATVHLDFRKRGYYKKMVISAVDVIHSLGKTMFMAYAVENEIAYPALKKLGFYHLFSQKKYVKILNIKKTFVIGAERLNKARFFKNASLNIRIVPDSEEPFMVRLQKGKCTIDEDSPDSDLALSGDLKKVVAFFIGNAQKEIITLILKRTVRVKFRITSLMKILRAAKMMWWHESEKS